MHELQRRSHSQLVASRAAAQSEGQMRESAAQLRLIADAMPALIAYIAPDGTYRFTNKLYQIWFGKAPEEVVGRHVRDVLGREAFEVLRPRLERALQGTRVFFEQTIPYASGPREVAVHYIPDVGIDGGVRGCFALIEDVSARKRGERALREADRRKDDFLAILGHELRNPLAPIRNVAHILSRSSVDPETVRRSGELLERQASHLTHLVDDLLDVGRIMRGRVALDRRAVAAGFGRRYGDRDSSLLARSKTPDGVVCRGAASTLTVNADSVRLCQVVANLLNNASKYSPDGARIEVRLEATTGEAVAQRA